MANRPLRRAVPCRNVYFWPLLDLRGSRSGLTSPGICLLGYLKGIIDLDA